MTFIIFFILGLIVGSFLNVVVYRLRIFDTIMGRSICPHCKNQISWYDNIPLLSFILLRAKCRNCEGQISWQYPLVEFFTGIIFVLVGYYFFDPAYILSWWETGFYLIIFSLFMVLLAYDWLYLEVPILIFWIILGIIGVNFIYNFYQEFNQGIRFFDMSWINYLMGGLVAWGFFFGLVFFSKEKWMGWGDVYVGLLAGLILGWPLILFGLLISFTIGAIYSIFIIIVKKGNLKSQIPFIPFLTIGTVSAFFIIKEFPSILNFFYF